MWGSEEIIKPEEDDEGLKISNDARATTTMLAAALQLALHLVSTAADPPCAQAPGSRRRELRQVELGVQVVCAAVCLIWRWAVRLCLPTVYTC